MTEDDIKNYSVLGMGFRYLAHVQQKKEIAKTRAEQSSARRS